MLLFSGKQKLLATVFWILSQVHGAPHAPLDPKDDFVQRNFNTIQRIYNLTVYPNNMPIVQKGAGEVPKDLFADKVVGRVSPVGNFTGFADSIEYFFGLAPVPTAVPTGIAIYQAYLSHFSSECPGIASSVVQLRTGKVDPTTGQLVPSALTTTLKQVAFWKFNKNGEVMQYEAWIPNLQAWTEYANGISFSNPLIQTAVPFQLCPTIQQRCTGKNQQFSNTTTCILGLERKPFGNFDAVSNSIRTICRRMKKADLCDIGLGRQYRMS
jgi:hypothetical protein